MKYLFQTKPFKHQGEVLQRSWNAYYWAYFMEMGTGKSKVCIDNAGILYERELIDTFIVIAPKGVYRNWATIEIPAHMPERIIRDVIIWKSSPTKELKTKLELLLQPNKTKGLRILIMNIEALSTPKGTRYLDKVLDEGTCLLTVDESTSIKNPKARRSKTVIKLGKKAKYKRILTGFPVTQSPLDLWAQCNFLHPQLLGKDVGSNFFQFQYRYAIMKKRSVGSHSFNLVVGYRNLESLSEIIKKFSSRVMKADCLDLPPKLYTQRHVQLTPDQQRLYTEIKEYALAHLGDEGFMTAPNVMTQLLRLQQVLSGHSKTDEGKLVEIKDNRLTELMACLEDASGKVIIWSRFRYDIKRIEKTLIKEYGPLSTVTYYGDTSDEERSEAIERFQNGDAQFFVGNPQTGGYGITLTAAETVIYFANSFDLAVRMQSEDRCHRIGQDKHVTYIDLIAEKTIDEKIVKSLRSKMDIASVVMGEELRQWLT